MISVSNDFKTAMKQPVKELQAYLNTEGLSIRDEDDLISYKIGGEGGLCKTVMRKLEAKYLGEHNLLGKWVSAGFGVKLPSGAYEFLNHGSFQVNELTFSKDTGETSIVAYDKMINAMKPYTALDVEYPIGLYDYTKKLCEACNLELGNDYFGKNRVPSFDSPLWKLENGAFINSDGALELPNMNSTGRVRFNWNQKDKYLYVQFVLTSGEGWLFYTYYYDEDGNRLNTNGNASTDKKDNNYLATVWFGGDDQYGEAIQKAKYIEIWFGRTADYGKQPYSVKNITADSRIDSGVSAYEPYNTMNDWPVERELWENIDGITYRDIFTQIAQATASTCIIGADDKVYFKPITGTGEQLTYDNMFKLKLEDQYGEINSVVLSRDPVEGEDVFLKDDESIAANGLTEFKISNNEIVDKNREGAIEPIYNALKGTKYYPFEATTEGLGWYEIGDAFDIVTDAGAVLPTVLFNINITVDGSLKETLKTVAETKTQTQYQYATSISKRIKNTEIIVNKQDGQIQSLVSDMYDDGGIVNEMYTKIIQDIDDIILSVQNSGGGNLLKDSVMFAYASSDEQKKNSPWEVSGDGELKIQSDTEAMASGGLSGHSFALGNMTVKQKVNVKVSTAEEKTYYTFSTRIKKNATGTCYVKIIDSEEITNAKEIITVADIQSGENPNYAEYSVTLEPKNGYYYVVFYGSADSGATFTDNMFAVGEYKSQWAQANGEVMNTQVNISVDGVLVKSSVYAGDYTVMSPLEFAGYSDVSGTMTKVFSLNRDVTEVEKLKARKEVTMAPIKIVPITTGDLQGWAFVPATEEG